MSVTDVAYQANAEHGETWLHIVNAANPPLARGYTPLTAYLDPHLFGKRSISFSSSKLKKIIGYELRRPLLTKETVTEVFESYKAEGIWPMSA